MSKGLKERIKKIVIDGVSILQDVILKQVDNRYLIFDTTLNVFGEGEDGESLYLRPNQKSPIYCVNIAMNSNIPTKLDIFDSLIQNHGYKDGARIVMFYNKNKMLVDEEFDNFATKQNTYIFTPLREIAEDIAFYYDTKILSSSDILRSLFDIGLVTDYHNRQDNFKVYNNLDIGSLTEDDMHFGFKSIFAGGIYDSLYRDVGGNLESKYTLYQGLGSNSAFFGGKPFVSKAISTDWSGYLAFSFDFNTKRTKGYIRHIRGQTRNYEKSQEIRSAYKDLAEAANGGDVSRYCITNVVALIDNPKVIGRLGSDLNITFKKREHLFRKSIVYKTPIEARDGSCDGIMLASDCSEYIQSIGKQHNIDAPKSNDMYGVDITGNYITFSFSETGESPHWSIVAPTRSGKTFFIMKIILQSLGIKVEGKTKAELLKIYEDYFGKIVPLDKVTEWRNLNTNNVVHFDIGYSALKFAVELKRAYPNEVAFFNDDLNNLRFGLTNIGYDQESKKISRKDLLFSISIINLILTINNEEPLTAREQGEIEEALERLFREDSYTGVELITLKKLGGYEEVLNRIKNDLGDKYDEYLKTTDLNLRGTDLDFLHKPLLIDVLKELNGKSENLSTKADEVESCQRAHGKLKIISKNPIFAYYDKSRVEDSKYFYMELETIKGLGEDVFLPIFLTIFQRLYRRDVLNAQKYKDRNKVPPKVLYVIEEAHNFIGIPSLRKLFNIILRESGRYNIHLGFITQSPSDIPPELLSNIATRIVMPSNALRGTDMRGYWGSAEDKDHPKNTRLFDFYDNYRRKYYAFMNIGDNIITIKTPVSFHEERLLNSNPTEIKKLLDIEEEQIDEDEEKHDD